MSIHDDMELIKKYNELSSIGSATVTIPWDQVMEVVVGDLMAKYKACKKRNDEYAASFRKVLEFYLTQDEIAEMESMMEEDSKAAGK